MHWRKGIGIPADAPPGLIVHSSPPHKGGGEIKGKSKSKSDGNGNGNGDSDSHSHSHSRSNSNSDCSGIGYRITAPPAATASARTTTQRRW